MRLPCVPKVRAVTLLTAHCLWLCLEGGWGRWALIPLRGSLKVSLSSRETSPVPAALGKCWGREQHPLSSSHSLLHGSGDQTWPEASPLSSRCFLEDVFWLRAGTCAAGCSQGTESIQPRFSKQLPCHGSWSWTWVCTSTGKHFRVGVALCHPSFAQTERRESV